MKFLLISVLILIFCGLVVGQKLNSKKSPSEKGQSEVLELERKWAEAYIRNDADFIKTIIADDFLGDRTKLEAWLKDIKERRLLHQSVEHENLQVRIYENVAILRGYAVIKGSNNGDDISGKYRFMDVFKKRGGHWLVIASQSVRVPNQ